MRVKSMMSCAVHARTDVPAPVEYRLPIRLGSLLAISSTMTEIPRSLASLSSPFPEKVTAFVDGMAAHGRYGQPCPRCGTPIQRLVYAQNEANYCPTCQTGGKLLADRALSRLLKDDWPKSLEELEEFKAARRNP